MGRNGNELGRSLMSGLSEAEETGANPWNKGKDMRTDCHSDSVHLSRSSLIQFVPPLSVVRSMGYGVCKA